jgi:hypothetical protein
MYRQRDVVAFGDRNSTTGSATRCAPCSKHLDANENAPRVEVEYHVRTIILPKQVTNSDGSGHLAQIPEMSRQAEIGHIGIILGHPQLEPPALLS